MAPQPGKADPTRRALRFAVFALLFVAATFLARATVLPQHELALFWPAAGVGVLWALVTVDRRELSLVALVVVGASALGNAATGTSLLTAVLFSLANLATVLGTRVVATVLAGRDGGVSPDRRAGRLATVPDIYRISAAASISAGVGGLFGMAGLHVAGADPGLVPWFLWTMRHLAAVVVIAMPALALHSWLRRPRPRPAPSWPEAQALIAATLAVQWFVFGAEQDLPLVFLPFALLFWSGTRMPLSLAALHGSLIAFSALIFVQLGGGGPVRAVSNQIAQALTMQAFMMLATGLALLISAAMSERVELIHTLGAAEQRARNQAWNLRSAKVKAERLLADAPHGVAVLDLSGTILQANTALAAMAGRPVEELPGTAFADLSPEHAPVAVAHLEEVATRARSLVGADWTINHGEHQRHVALSSRLLQGRGEGDAFVLVNVVDLSERRRYEQRLAHLADHDVLTGLLNRRRFDEAMQQQLDRCARYGYRGAMLLLDLDNFKEVNDTLGHAVGDQLLVSVATILRNNLRVGDVVARLGGDEFAVLMSEADRAGAETVAAGLVESVRDHTATLDGVSRRVTASIGVVTFAGAFEHDEDPLTLADMLMYDAKDAGRDQYAVLDDELFRSPRSGPGWRGGTGSNAPWRTTTSRCTCSRSWTCTPTASPAPRRCCGSSTTGSPCRPPASSTSPSGPASSPRSTPGWCARPWRCWRGCASSTRTSSSP